MKLEINLKQIAFEGIPFSQQIAKWRFSRKLSKLKTKNADIYNRILLPDVTSNWIGKAIDSGSPLMISRFGDVESQCILEYLNGKISEHAVERMFIQAGFFPPVEKSLEEYSQLFLESSKKIDLLGVWFRFGEAEIIRKSCSTASFTQLKSLEPYFHTNPWSKYLKGKKILVVHPFSETISQQFLKHRELIFQNPDTLPNFELSTLKSVQSVAGMKTDFDTWFDAYYYMCNQIKKINFDLAILGCGSYGLPLAAYIKDLGKQAIHLGGPTQLLFGIKGKRWDKRPEFKELYNEYWVRPNIREIPESFTKVDNGAYW